MRHDRYVPAILDALSRRSARTVLDVGCGTGYLGREIARAIPGVSVIGCDPDAIATGIARNQSPEVGTIRCAAEFLPFESHTFDAVVSTLAFHHMGAGQKRSAFCEVRRVLRPGGSIFLADLGRPMGGFDWFSSWSTRMLDGFATTRENFEGRVPELMSDASIEGVKSEFAVSTLAGSVWLYSGVTASEGSQP